MANNYSNLRKMWDIRYTPINDEVQELLLLLKKECGGTWRLVAEITGVKARHIRRLRRDGHKAVSFRTMDQLFCRSRHIHRLLQLEWLTVDELLERGLWRPQFAKELSDVLRPQDDSQENDDGVEKDDDPDASPRHVPN